MPLGDILKELHDEAKATLEGCSNREVRLHYLAARRWFGWREDDPNTNERSRNGQIDAVLGADPIAVEGGAFDFWAHRKLIKRKSLRDWRNQDD